MSGALRPRQLRRVSARERIARLFDACSFRERLPPATRVMSPPGQLKVPEAFDDGVAIGEARLADHAYSSAPRKEFMGGGVGEVHGAKLVGLFKRPARPTRRGALLAESGGVRCTRPMPA
jgi:malonate decarboxylase beta subunit